jgi:hypothetical protein
MPQQFVAKNQRQTAPRGVPFSLVYKDRYRVMISGPITLVGNHVEIHGT